LAEAHERGHEEQRDQNGHQVLEKNVRNRFAINRWIFKDIPFDYARDFVPGTMVNDGPMLVVVNSQSPVASFKDLIGSSRPT